MRLTTRREFTISLSVLAGASAWAQLPLAQTVQRRHLALKAAKSNDLASPATGAAGTSLTAGQTATVAGLCAAIIPADRSPSARDLGAHLYVVAGLSLVPVSELAIVRLGLDAIAAIAQGNFGAPVELLPPNALQHLASVVSTHPDLAPLWDAVRSLTVLYYYAQPAGFADLGLPGPSIDAGGYPFPNSLPCPVAPRRG